MDQRWVSKVTQSADDDEPAVLGAGGAAPAAPLTDREQDKAFGDPWWILEHQVLPNLYAKKRIAVERILAAHASQQAALRQLADEMLHDEPRPIDGRPGFTMGGYSSLYWGGRLARLLGATGETK